MKKLYVLIMILSLTLLLEGCKSNTSIVSNGSTKSENSGLVKNNQQTLGKATESVMVSPTEKAIKDDLYSRIPPAADFSTLSQQLTSLEDTRKWGNSLDFRQSDLSALNMTKNFKQLSKLVFDSVTKWPSKLPKGFDPVTIMETGKNPGLGIRNLHTKGITGNGVNIGVVDYTLLVNHKEYGKQIKYYGEVNCLDNAEMHGSIVSSLSVGKTTGVAPDAGLYFVASNNVTSINNKRVLDYTSYANSIYKIIKENKTLPQNQKIRVLSISAGWCPENKGYKEITKAIEKAKKEGIFVISCNLFETYGFWTYSLEKDSYSDPDNVDSYKPYQWDLWMDMMANVDGFIPYYENAFKKNFAGKMLLVPIGSRTTASPTGKNDYCFYSDGGWSTMEPYLAGLYTMACQVKPDITPDFFWKVALETGEPREIVKGNHKYPASMLNPEKLIAKLKE